MKIDRLFGILTVLLRNENVTAPQLAAQFEVTRRTIGRDIDALCMAGIPVITRQGGGGGISIAEGYKFDKSILTADELSAIISALKGLGSVSEKSRAERTLQKLTHHTDTVVSMREPVIIDLASHYKGQLTEKIEFFKHAISEKRIAEFDYYYTKGETRRRIEPYFIIFQWSAWYVFGFCLLRGDFRMFKFQRLWDLTLCGEIFNPREIPPDKTDFSAGFPDDKKLVALFWPSEKYRLIETYGLNCYTETPDGLLLETGYTNRDFIVGWLLGFGGRVRVFEPEDIANEIKAEAENILSAYK